MKKFLFIMSLSVILVLTISVVILLLKNSRYQDDFYNIFGDDNFYIEEISVPTENSHLYEKQLRFCVRGSQSENGFVILENYLNDKGYEYYPDEQLGACWFFYNEKGDSIEAIRTDYYNYSEWILLFKNNMNTRG